MLQPQYTSYNPFLQQQMVAQQQQQQQEEFMRQQMMLAEQQRQQQEWNQQQQLLQQQQQQQQQAALMAQPTGYRSNNPFAPASQSIIPSGGFSMPQQQQQQQQVQPQATGFLNIPSVSTPQFEQPAPSSSPSPSPFRPSGPSTPKRDDGKHAHLASLLANNEGGMDTFGNVGNLRVPVGSAFHPSNRAAFTQGSAGSTNPFGQRQNQNQNGQGGAANGQSDQPFFSL